MQAILQFIFDLPLISLKHKKGVYKKLVKYGNAPDAPFCKDFYGLKYEGNLNNSIEFNIYYYDAFEKPLLFFLRDTMFNLNKLAGQEEQQFFDIGANIGQHSLFMSQIASQVLSFEPYDAVSDKLKHHIAINQIKNIELHSLGLSNKTEELDFYAPTGRNQGIGSFDASTVSKGNTNLGKLRLVNGDEYLQQKQRLSMSLVKIDVEGFEKNVLEGLKDTLQEARPIMVIEISYDSALSFESMDELRSLLPVDYELFTFNTRKADGSKARRRGAKARHSGAYRLVPFTQWRKSGQDDVVACPVEKLEQLPKGN
ncbi:MAG: hypothetical protein COA96_00305 [SAR86 cluster bacterium]|uniref:Methyltransferase FkbM domain-containing protein n=1 Tax=SAR86 cluster bacterium TaxID=2030880 RepID=A0A2A5BBB0_9GAMM|nr:MAG: hypothetical protein COA96_00305 [SAR86 cluster bacterium]